MTSCIDLRERFNDRYRVDVDPSYRADTGSSKNSNRDPWNWVLKGKRGHICPWGGDLLAVCIEGHPKICRKLALEPWVITTQYGDDGINAVIHIDDFEKAVSYVKLYRKRQMTDERKEALVAMGREHGFKNSTGDTQFRSPESTRRVMVDTHGGFLFS